MPTYFWDITTHATWRTDAWHQQEIFYVNTCTATVCRLSIPTILYQLPARHFLYRKAVRPATIPFLITAIQGLHSPCFVRVQMPTRDPGCPRPLLVPARLMQQKKDSAKPTRPSIMQL